MKISKEQKNKNRRKMLETAVQIMGAEGISNTTMKDISQKAGFSEPLIYKYFPTKEHLLFSYFEESFLDVKKQLEENPIFQEMAFSEQLQMLMDTMIQYHSGNREFVKAAFKSIYTYNLSVTLSELEKHKGMFLDFINTLFEVAVESGELEDIPYKDFILKSFWDYHIFVVSYWTRDESENFDNTTQLIDKSIALLHAFLNSKVLDRSMDLINFFLRQHVFDNLEKLTEMSLGRDFKKKKKSLFEDKIKK